MTPSQSFTLSQMNSVAFQFIVFNRCPFAFLSRPELVSSLLSDSNLKQPVKPPSPALLCFSLFPSFLLPRFLSLTPLIPSIRTSTISPYPSPFRCFIWTQSFFAQMLSFQIPSLSSHLPVPLCHASLTDTSSNRC